MGGGDGRNGGRAVGMGGVEEDRIEEVEFNQRGCAEGGF